MTSLQQIHEIAAHNRRVRALSISAWLATAATVLVFTGAFTDSEHLMGIGSITLIAAGSTNLGSFLAYAVRLGRASRLHNAQNRTQP